jgi:hypothetical protein
MYTCDICGRTDTLPQAVVTRVRLPMKDATAQQGMVLFQIDICEQCSDNIVGFIRQKMVEARAKVIPQAPQITAGIPVTGEQSTVGTATVG